MHAQLYALIQQLAATAYAAGDDAAVCATLNTPSNRHVDTTLRTGRWVIVTFGSQSAALILGTIKAASAANPIVEAGYLSLMSDGLDLSHEITQELIDHLATAARWPTELRDALKSKGVWFTSPAGDAFGREVTTDDVAQARRWHTLTRRAADAYNATVAAIDANAVVAWPEAVAVFEATE